MRTYTLFCFLYLGLCACGGASSSTLSFSDPAAALDAADAAQAAGNAETASEGYAFALEHGDTQTQGDALLGQLGLRIATNQENLASEKFDQMKDAFGDRLDQDTLLQLCQNASEASMADLGESLVAYSLERYPAMREELAGIESALQDLGKNLRPSKTGGTGYAD